MKLSLKSILINSTGTLFSRTLGLFRALVINYFFGKVDEFLAMFSIPDSLRLILAEGVMNNVIVPVYREVLEKEGKEVANRFVSSIFFIFLLITAPIFLFLAFFPTPLLRVFLPGFSNESINISKNLLLYISPFIVFISLQAILMAVLNSIGKFFVPAYAPVLYNLTMIIGAFFFHHLGQKVLGICVSIGGFLMLLAMFISSLKNGIKIYLTIETDQYVKKFFSLYKAVFVGLLITLFVSILNKPFGSFYPGAITAFMNAYIIFQLPVGILAVALSIVSINQLSIHFARNDKKEFLDTFADTLNLWLFLFIPMTVFFVVFPESFSDLIYKYIPKLIVGSTGKYSETLLYMTKESFRRYSLALLPYTGLVVLNKVFYSMQDTVKPLYTNMLVAITYLSLNILFVILLKLGYLFIPTSFMIAQYVGLSLLLFFIFKERLMEGWVAKKVSKELTKTILSTLTALILSIAFIYVLKLHGLSRIIISFLVFWGSFLIMMFVTRSYITVYVLNKLVRLLY